MTANPFAALLRYVEAFTFKGNTPQPDAHGKWVRRKDVLAALAAAVPDDLAEAGKLVEGLRELGHLHMLGRCLSSADLITALLARIAAQEAQIAEAQKATKTAEAVADIGKSFHDLVVKERDLARHQLSAMTKERDELRKRLEIDGYWVERDGEMVRVEGDPGVDGIECRDATIELLDEALAAERAKVAKLVEAGNGLHSLVEGIQGAMQHGTWRDEKGQRLKDTPEWVAFYNARAAITEAGQ